MSGHSKWATIKRQKGLNDAKRGNVFTKIAGAITIAARLGGSGDPDSNPRLRLAVESARAVNMPKENIQRAIDRGLGNIPGQVLEEILYEGYGPGKVAFIVEGFTDNKNRTYAEIRNLFDKNGGNLGSTGSTAYMFDRLGEIKVKSKGKSREEEELELIDLGAEDVEELESDGNLEFLVYAKVPELYTMGNKITQSGFTTLSTEIVYKPNMLLEINDKDQAEKVLNFAEKLEDHDDIQKVFSNLDIPETLF